MMGAANAALLYNVNGEPHSHRVSGEQVAACVCQQEVSQPIATALLLLM